MTDNVTKDLLHILRNPFGHDDFVVREARLTAASLIEVLQHSEEQRMREVERLRAAIEFVLPMAEEEWGHHNCPTNGLKAVALMHAALSHNVEFSGVPAGHSSNHPAGGTSAGTQG